MILNPQIILKSSYQDTKEILTDKFNLVYNDHPQRSSSCGHVYFMKIQNETHKWWLL